MHLRSDSLPLPVARRLIGAHRLLGVSVHSVSEAVQAEAGGADYMVFGPIYETPSKHMYGPPLGLSKLEEAARAVRVPIVGIGGVTAARARDMRSAARSESPSSPPSSARRMRKRRRERCSTPSRQHHDRLKKPDSTRENLPSS